MSHALKPGLVITRKDGTRALYSDTGIWMAECVDRQPRRFHFGHTFFITVVVLVCFAAITVGVRVITAH